MPPSDAAARCRGVVQIYRAASGDVHALRGIDADFMPGSVTAIVGPSGSGKTTLMRILSLTERPTGGDVTIAGVDTQYASAREIRRLRRNVLAKLERVVPDVTIRLVTAGQSVVGSTSDESYGEIEYSYGGRAAKTRSTSHREALPQIGRASCRERVWTVV